MKKQPLLNTYVNNIDMKETVQAIDNMIVTGKKSYIVPINVDVVIKIEKDPYLKRIIDSADMVLVDGKPLIWISNWYKRPIKEKISGSDLVPLLCRKAVKKGYTIFILGGKEGIAKETKTNLEKIFPNVNIIGTHHGYFDENEEKEVIEGINKLQPNVLFVALRSTISRKMDSKT